MAAEKTVNFFVTGNKARNSRQWYRWINSFFPSRDGQEVHKNCGMVGEMKWRSRKYRRISTWEREALKDELLHREKETKYEENKESKKRKETMAKDSNKNQ